MPSLRQILKMALITAGTMFALNQLAAMSPFLRRIIKGQVVSPVGDQNNRTTTIPV